MKDRYQCSSEAVETLFEVNDYVSHPYMSDNTNILLFWRDKEVSYPLSHSSILCTFKGHLGGAKKTTPENTK